jgi:DNA-binding MarR family transcriptional regulator
MMSNVFEDLVGLDKLIHEPARLSILTALAALLGADFLALKHLTGLTGGNLSTHLSKLEEAGLIAQAKQFVGKRPNTQVKITAKGRAAVENHWKQLESLRQDAQQWKREK